MSDDVTFGGTPKKAPHQMDAKVRTGLDISIIAFMMGAAFNAGIVYNKLGQMDIRIGHTEDSITQIEHDQQPLSERVARMEAILADIRDELHQQNENRKP